MEKRGRGRPKLDSKGRDSILMAIRTTGDERKAYERAAKLADQSLSEWIREHLGQAAGLSKRD